VNVAVFGGSFNPPHVAHVLVPLLVQSTNDVERVIVVPTFRHPFGKAMAPFADRVAMAERAFAGQAGTSVSRIEEELGGESYTVRTLEALHDRMPGVALRLLVGADVLTQTDRWREWDRVVALAPPYVVGRDGSSSDAPELLAVSSTEVRARYASHGSVERLVPRAVDDYVRSHGLYGAA